MNFKQSVQKIGLGSFLLFLCVSCSHSAFIKGSYDEESESANLLSDSWSESDMAKVADDIVAEMPKSLFRSKNIKVVATKIKNKTSEHIDTSSIMDKIRIALMKQHGVRFIDKSGRKSIQDELAYQAKYAHEAKKTRKQSAASYILHGSLSSIVQEGGRNKTVYYKISFNLSDIESGDIVWSDEAKLRKRYKKRRVGF